MSNAGESSSESYKIGGALYSLRQEPLSQKIYLYNDGRVFDTAEGFSEGQEKIFKKALQVIKMDMVKAQGTLNRHQALLQMLGETPANLEHFKT